MNIKTKYKTNDNGTAQIVAKSNGKQRTVNVDHSKSLNWNHGNAAGTLARALEFPVPRDIAHESNESGSEHTFIWQ